MSEPKNCHYVTRGLTKPWEAKDRHLWFYDFERKQVRQLSSKSLFAGDGLLTPAGELKFKQVIEDPLVEFRQKILIDPAANDFEWKVFRATSLYFMGQIQRFSIFLGNKRTDGSLETFLQKDETYHDQLALVSQKKYQIIGITIPNTQQLFFPQAGFFSFYFLDNSRNQNYSSGLAVPLTPHICMAMVDRAADTEQLKNQLQIISPFSIGLGSNCKQVIIPPEVRNANDDKSIEIHIRDKRDQAVAATQDFLKMKALISQMNQMAGLPDEEELATFDQS